MLDAAIQQQQQQQKQKHRGDDVNVW